MSWSLHPSPAQAVCGAVHTTFALWQVPIALPSTPVKSRQESSFDGSWRQQKLVVLDTAGCTSCCSGTFLALTSCQPSVLDLSWDSKQPCTWRHCFSLSGTWELPGKRALRGLQLKHKLINVRDNSWKPNGLPGLETRGHSRRLCQSELTVQQVCCLAPQVAHPSTPSASATGRTFLKTPGSVLCTPARIRLICTTHPWDELSAVSEASEFFGSIYQQPWSVANPVPTSWQCFIARQIWKRFHALSRFPFLPVTKITYLHSVVFSKTAKQAMPWPTQFSTDSKIKSYLNAISLPETEDYRIFGLILGWQGP